MRRPSHLYPRIVYQDVQFRKVLNDSIEHPDYIRISALALHERKNRWKEPEYMEQKATIGFV